MMRGTLTTTAMTAAGNMYMHKCFHRAVILRWIRYACGEL
jgi:hypothetical protein